jgi:hypothetical protein
LSPEAQLASVVHGELPLAGVHVPALPQNAAVPQSPLPVHATVVAHFDVDGSHTSGAAHCSVDVHESPALPCGAHVLPRQVSPFTQFASLLHDPPGLLATHCFVVASHAAPVPHWLSLVQPTVLHVLVSGAHTRLPEQSAAFVHSDPFGFPVTPGFAQVHCPS